MPNPLLRAIYGDDPVTIWVGHRGDFRGRALTLPAPVDGYEYFSACPVRPNASKRAKEQAAHTARAIWADLDEYPVKGLRVPPSIVLLTSPGRHQAWWILEDPVPSDVAERIAQRIAKQHGIDDCWDRLHYMRLPGTRNTKYQDQPLVEIVSENSKRYRTSDFRVYDTVIEDEFTEKKDKSKSGDFYRWVKDNCVYPGLSVEEAITMASESADGKERFDRPEYLASDVRRIYEKYETKHETKQETSYEFVSGGSFLLDVPELETPIWGDGHQSLWSPGEALIIYGGDGVGKTTLAGQLLMARVGLLDDVLGFPVQSDGKRVLYLACDRPRQAQRALHRLVKPEWKDILTSRISFHIGPPFETFDKDTNLLTAMCKAADADTVIIDSLKDVCSAISQDEVGTAYNRARQTAIAAGIEVLELHHPRKANAENKEPNTLADLYGSRWITAGSGSVICLFGDAGDPIVRFTHLKQPMDEVGPFNILHNQVTGISTVHREVDLLALAKLSGGVTAKKAAQAIYEKEKPTANEIKRAERRLEKLNLARKIPGKRGGPAGSGASVWVVD